MVYLSNLNFLFIPVALFMGIHFHPGFLLIPKTWVLVHLCILSLFTPVSLYLYIYLTFVPIYPCYLGVWFTYLIFCSIYIYIYIYIFTLCAYLPLQPGFMVHLSNLNPGFHAFQIKPLSLQQIWATIVMGVKCPFYRQ